MILRDSTFHNFLVYHGSQWTDLPVGGDRSLAEVTFGRQSGSRTERIILRPSLEGSRRGPDTWVEIRDDLEKAA